VKVLALSLLLLTFGVANAQQLPNSASASQQTVAMSARTADAPPAAGRSTMGTHIGDRSFKAVADKKFWAVTGLMTGSTISAAELTGRCEAETTCSFMGPFNSRKKTYALGMPVNFGMMELTYRLKRSGKKYWFVPAVAGTALNTIVAVHSADHLK
jgi:hypothetical protein